MLLTPLRRLIFPAILLAVALVVEFTVLDMPGGWPKVLDWLPYASLGMALALSGYNGRSRPFAAAATLLLIYQLIADRLQVSLDHDDALIVYSLISVLYPLQILYLLLVPERGLWNRYGVAIVASVPVLVIATLLVLHYVPHSDLMRTIAGWLAVKPLDGYILSGWASALFGLVFAAGLFLLWRRDSEHEAMLTAVLVIVYVMLALFDRPNISDVMLSLAGITLIVGIMKASYELAYHDELTGLLGRRALNERLESLGKRYVIAMLDIDHFKKFNDTYGHDSGDDVLKMVATHINAVGGGGTAYRYGGEEFCVVFPNRDLNFCKPFLEALRATVAAYTMILRDKENRPESEKVARERRGRRAKNRKGGVSVTISIGAAEAGPQYASVYDVVKAADNALYRAKKKGRNCVVVGG